MLKKLGHICMLFSILIIYGCGITKEMQAYRNVSKNSKNFFRDNVAGWRPDEFNPESGILLIQKANTEDGKQQKKMEDFMLKKYPYKYEFFDGTYNINNDSNYNNKDKFRYFLAIQQIEREYRQKPDPKFGRYATKITKYKVYDFHFVDRKNDKVYPNSGEEEHDAVHPLSKIINNVLKRD